MTMIASWNVNSVKARLPNVLEWLKQAQPDIVLLQEIKCVDENFPRLEIEDLGYNVETHGQKSYNGVAILSKMPIEVVCRGLPGNDEDEQARYIEAEIEDLRVASIYLPNGNPVDTEKYDYKLAWMKRLRAHAEARLEEEPTLVLGGDYNVIPEARDCYDPEAWIYDALFKLETRAEFRAIVNLGLYDAFRIAEPEAEDAYTFWDYQGGRWQRDEGIRIDHFLLSPQAVDRLDTCWIDKDARSKPKASDHTPICVKLT